MAAITAVFEALDLNVNWSLVESVPKVMVSTLVNIVGPLRVTPLLLFTVRLDTILSTNPPEGMDCAELPIIAKTEFEF